MTEKTDGGSNAAFRILAAAYFVGEEDQMILANRRG